MAPLPLRARLHHLGRRIYYRIPFRLRSIGSRVLFYPLDLVARWRGGDGDGLPPRGQRLVGPGSFKAIGEAWVRIFIEQAQLAPAESVLDVGCGIGRIAVPLARYLDAEKGGRYAGFDVVPDFIQWCREHVSSRHPNFRFDLLDVSNSEYNAGGAVDGATARFPYESGSFDFVFLGSVFTHMLTAAVENYVREVARVLRPGGRGLITFFLLNDESRAMIDGGKAFLPLKVEVGECRVLDRRNPEADVAHDEQRIRALLQASGLEVVDTQYGGWCGRANPQFQDVVIVRKAGAPATR